MKIKAMFLVVAVFASLLFSRNVFAGWIEQYKVEVSIRNHSANFNAGEIAVFDIAVKKWTLMYNGRGGYYLTYINADPFYPLIATFPNDGTRVQPARLSAGRYTYKSDILRSSGTKVFKAKIAMVFFDKIFYILAENSVKINVIGDITPPQNPSVAIDIEGGITDDSDVSLILSADGADSMVISENISFAGSTWEPYAVSKIFRLSNPGRKNIYVKFRDVAGNETNAISVSVTLVPSVKPISNGAVKVQGRQIFVANAPYKMKGVTYQPVPIWLSAENVGPDIYYTNAICDRDFAMLKDMGCNTVRTYGKVNAVILNKAQAYGIKVCAGFWISYYADLGDPNVRKGIIAEFRNYVRRFKIYPAVLLWAMGNEQNYQNGNSADYYSLVNKLAMVAYDEEGQNYHPVSIVNGDICNIGNAGKSADDVSLNYVDVWGANVYAGYSFLHNPHHLNFFDQYSNLSGKPLWISEYGVDAYDNEHNAESQKRQAAWDCADWEEIAGSSVCIGATLMSYSDEWWKAGDPYDHDTGGYATGTMPYTYCQPDRFLNEEWWGVMQSVKRSAGIDQMVPRLVYYELKKRWAEMAAPLIIDDYNDGRDPNLRGGSSFTYDSPSSSSDYCSYSYQNVDGRDCLAISYNAVDSGSWAGYFTQVSNADVRQYDVLTFFVKGILGGELCKVGIKDARGHETKINFAEYLPHGITNTWQRVSIPLYAFGGNVDFSCLENISFGFENAIVSGSGEIYMDDLSFSAENRNSLTPLIVTNFNSTSYYNQNALGFSPVALRSGNSQSNYSFISNQGENGTPCLGISYVLRNGNACRILTGLNGICPFPYKNLSFSAKGQAGGENFNVYLEDIWHNRAHFEVNGLTTGWQSFNIPLYYFVLDGVDITNLVNLDIVFEWGADRSGAVYLDNIEFEN